jgi:predicted Zn-dependent peptidase
MKPKFFRKVLSNGVTVILEKRDLPIVSVVFAIKSGGLHESKENRGISHFIEHMLYKGTKKRNTQQIASEIERNGGELNGFTMESGVGYWCKMPSKHLGVALDVLSDMVKNPLFDKKELEKERKVIFEEIKMYKDNPRMHVLDESQKTLYGGILGVGLAGTVETMSSINRDEMVKIFEKNYASDNMVLCVVGDADFETLCKFVEENFPNKKSDISFEKIVLKNEERIEERKDLDQANLVFGYHAPLAGDKKAYASQVLSTLMAGGMSARLWHEIREKRNLAYGVKGDVSIDKDFSYGIVFVGTMKENVEKVKKIIIEEFKKASKDLTEKEMNEVKEQIIGNYHISMEDSQSQMVNLLSSEISGSANDFYDFEKNIRAVKIGDVKKLAEKISKEHSFFALVPKD